MALTVLVWTRYPSRSFAFLRWTAAELEVAFAHGILQGNTSASSVSEICMRHTFVCATTWKTQDVWPFSAAHVVVSPVVILLATLKPPEIQSMVAPMVALTSMDPDSSLLFSHVGAFAHLMGCCASVLARSYRVACVAGNAQ